ncbi:hypothetical protein, partial [uncultured Corynebacterium sp.]|uniref:hypothetical protein n=1 Tax=uncultured Corynebacterium sp. TaxID=159447 RepID=UPI0025D347BF
MSTTSQVAQGVEGAAVTPPADLSTVSASAAQLSPVAPAKPLSRVDRFMHRILRINRTDPIDMKAVAGAHRAFRWAIVVSAIRCTISYVIIPILIPVISVMGSLAGTITIALCVVALV